MKGDVCADVGTVQRSFVGRGLSTPNWPRRRPRMFKVPTDWHCVLGQKHEGSVANAQAVAEERTLCTQMQDAGRRARVGRVLWKSEFDDIASTPMFLVCRSAQQDGWRGKLGGQRKQRTAGVMLVHARSMLVHARSLDA